MNVLRLPAIAGKAISSKRVAVPSLPKKLELYRHLRVDK
jgi:hypothetical protein